MKKMFSKKDKLHPVTKFCKKSILINIIKTICMITIVVVPLLNLSANTHPFSTFLILFLNIVMLSRCRNNMMMFMLIIVLAYSNYSILYANYIHVITTSMFTDPITSDINNSALNILLLFNCLFFLFLKWDVPDAQEIYLIKPQKCDRRIIYLMTLILVVVFFLGFDAPEEEGLRGSPKPIYEYSLVFFIFLFYYSGGHKQYLMLGLILALFFSLQNFIYGGRIYGIQFLLCTYYFVFVNNIKRKYVFMLLAAMFVLMSIIGSVRGALMEGDADVEGIMSKTIENGFSLNTAYAAYYTSKTFIYAHDMMSVNEIGRLLWSFLKSIFVGISKDDILPNVTQNYFTHYGGGVYPIYIYFYLDLVGVVVAAYILRVYSNLIKNINMISNELFQCIAVYISCSAFRWYLYTPIILFRGVLFLSMIYYGCLFIRRLNIKPNHSKY